MAGWKNRLPTVSGPFHVTNFMNKTKIRALKFDNENILPPNWGNIMVVLVSLIDCENILPPNWDNITVVLVSLKF